MFLDDSDGADVLNNTVLTNNGIGIYLWKSDGCDIINNTIKDNGCGIFLDEFSDYNYIYRNLIINNRTFYDRASNY